jgi:hypothetical protein
VILGGDDQTANGCPAGRIAALILVEQSEKAGFKLLEIGLPDARDHGGERRAGIAQQLSKVIFRDRGERSEQLDELGFADRGWAGLSHGRALPCPTFGKPTFEFGALAALRGCHEVIMTSRCRTRVAAAFP